MPASAAGGEPVSGPPRVCMVVCNFSPAVGGTERQAEALARGLLAEGGETFVLTQRAAGLPREEISGGLRVLRRLGGPERRGIEGIGYLLGAARLLLRERRRYDLIHCHGIYLHTVAAVLVARAAGKRVVVKAACGGAYGDLAAMRRHKGGRALIAICRAADRFVAVSSEIADELRAAGVPARRIVAMPPLLDTERFRPAETAEKAALRGALGLPASGLLVSSVGRLAPQKGLGTLLDAWGRLVDRPRATLLLVGDGPARGELERRARGDDTAGRVRFLGERRDVADILRASDAFAFHSLSEGMLNALVEAMACGLPCVSSATGGARDLVRHGLNGLLVEPSDAAALAGALETILLDAGLRLRLGEAARAAAAARCAARLVTGRYRALYRELRAPAM